MATGLRDGQAVLAKDMVVAQAFEVEGAFVVVRGGDGTIGGDPADGIGADLALGDLADLPGRRLARAWLPE